MAKQDLRSPDDPFRPQDGPWQDRVVRSQDIPIAYRPDELLVQGPENAEQVSTYLSRIAGDVQATRVYRDFVLLETTGEFDVPATILELREREIEAEANVVFFNHCGCGCCCGGWGGFAGNPFNSNPFNSNPFNSNPFNSNPFNSNPFNSNPFNSNPFNSNPFNSNPFNSNPFNSNWAATGERPSSARPADKPPAGPKHPPGQGKAIVLDTGIAHTNFIPAMLDARPEHKNAAAADREVPDSDSDNLLDASSGHGTFIAGIIEQIAPGHSVQCARVLGNFGDGDAASIANRIEALLPQIDKNTILNMSFGSYGDPELHVLSAAIEDAQNAGAVVVSSAGNDGTCLRSYPAALPDVVSVGSIDAGGKAFYSNFGNWVRACAPGTDVVSSFFTNFDGDTPPIPGAGDPDKFEQWAQWSGTSFAAPIVVAALLRHMALRGGTAKEAVEAIIDAPTLGRMPGLGTVVNLVPGL